MKKYLVLLMLLVSIIACDDYLDPKISQRVPSEKLLTQPDMVLGLVYFAYRSIPSTNDNFGNDFLESATDNAVSNNLSGGINKMATLSSYLSDTRNPLDVWALRYEDIMSINRFFTLDDENDLIYVKSSERNDSIQKQTIRGEAYFLRAWCHFDLLRRFGGKDINGNMLGVPLALEDITADEFATKARSSYLETVEAIVTDLDSAIVYLPENWADVPEISPDYLYLGESLNNGRPTALICNALKSRLYLYAASPAFSEGLSSDVVKGLYLKSAAASMYVLDELGFDYQEFIYWDDVENISEVFFNNAQNSELIMRRVSGNGVYEMDHGLESRHLIPSLYGGGRCNPSHNLVNAFPMRNGYPIDDPQNRGGYDPENPFDNRDPRLYQTIIYNGYDYNGNVVETFDGGKDFPGGSPLATVSNSTRTGYYMRKWLSSKVNLASGQGVKDYHYSTIFRKVEMLLNFSEAVFYANDNNPNIAYDGKTAKDAIEAILKRAVFSSSYPYLEEAAGDPDKFEDLIRNQRRIELCFENGHRFYDVRRWKYDEALMAPVKGVKYANINDLKGSVFDVIESPSFKAGQYYLPIPKNELNVMPNLTQNFGW